MAQAEQAATKTILALLAAALIIAASVSFRRPFNHDEFEHIHAGWKVAQGQRIYADFYENHHPLFYRFLAPAIRFSGENTATVWRLRAVMLVFVGFILWLTYLTAERIFGRPAGGMAAFLLATAYVFVDKAIEIRPDVPQTALGMAAVLFFVRHVQSGRMRDLAACAFTAALAFLFLQKAAPLIALLVFAAGTEGVRRKRFWRTAGVYGITSVLTAAPFYAHIWMSGAWPDYWICAWAVNMRFAERFLPFGILKESYKINTHLWCFWGLTLCFFCRGAAARYLGMISAGLVLFLFAQRTGYGQNLLMVMPLLCVLASEALLRVFEGSRKALAVFLIAVSLWPCVKLLNQPVEIGRMQLEKADYVLKAAGPGERVYDGNGMFNLFREDMDYFWFGLRPKDGLETYQAIRPYDYDVYELIGRRKPKVLSKRYIPDMAHPAISAHYVRSDVYPDLYLRE